MTDRAQASFDESLRNALHAAVDHLDPAPDGLQRISARLTRPHPVGVAWAMAAWTALSLRTPDSARSALAVLASAFRRVSERFAGTQHAHGRESYGRLGWLRPAAAVGTAVFVVAAGAYVALVAPRAISPQGSASYSAGTTTGGKAGHTATGPGGTGTQPGHKRHGGGSNKSNGVVENSGCGGSHAHKTPSPSQSTSVSPTTSPTASSTPTSTPTPTQSATATPTPTATPTSSTSSSPNPGSAASPPDSTGNGEPGSTPTGNPSTSTVNGPSVNRFGRRDQAAARPSQSPCPSKSSTASPSQAQTQGEAQTQAQVQLFGISLPLSPGLVLIVADQKGKLG
jgi:hypothetical protein